MKVGAIPVAVWVTLYLLFLPALTRGQSPQVNGKTSDTRSGAPPAQLNMTYTPPTRSQMLHHYFSDSFGAFAIMSVAAAAGIDQATSFPPDWQQGLKGYGQRFASEFGMATVTTTMRYALGAALKEDTVYYPCQCTGAWPRLRHAVMTSFTAYRKDGHEVFSVPAFVAPYVATTTAVSVWFPRRYDYEDALRLGNYYLLYDIAGNIATEFLANAPHAVFSHLHLRSRQNSPDSDFVPSSSGN